MIEIRKTIYLLFLFAFIVLSVLYINPTTKKAVSEFRSIDLQQKTINEGDQIITEYTNLKGEVTVAVDLGYSTKSITKFQSGTIEEYFNPDGELVMCTSGYYAIYREYDDCENSIYTTYLDANREPIINLFGYAKEGTQFSDTGKKITIHFFDTLGDPICSVSEGYGKRYEYNTNGKISSITYLNEFDEPMVAGNGYALVKRTFYFTDDLKNGKIENEFYFDVDGHPISLALGQYGLHREYNDVGENSMVTYLDSEGNPIITTKGYTSVLREYQGSSYSERYFDIDGNPCKMPEGQYGIKKVDGQTIYLDYDGKEQVNIKRFFFNQSKLVILIVLILILISLVVNKKGNLILLVLYCSAIVYLTLLFRESNSSELRLKLFGSYIKLFTNDETRSEILRNIWLFIPVGTIVFSLFHKKESLLIPIFLSVIIEIIQYLSKTGWCQLDDVISNGLGGVIGFYTGKLLYDHIIYPYKERIRNENGK